MTLYMYAVKVIRRIPNSDLAKVNELVQEEILRRDKTQNNTRGVHNGKST